MIGETNKPMNLPRGVRTHRKIAAYHEAGHALAALQEGRRVGAVFLSPAHPESGTCLIGGSERNPYDVLLNHGSAKAAWLETVESTRSDIRIALAGPLAEAKFVGKPLRALGSKPDLDSCIYQVERLARLRSFIEEYIQVEPFYPEHMLEREKPKKIYTRRMHGMPCHPLNSRPGVLRLNLIDLLREIPENRRPHGESGIRK